jgi:hypothetical protein
MLSQHGVMDEEASELRILILITHSFTGDRC